MRKLFCSIGLLLCLGACVGQAPDWQRYDIDCVTSDSHAVTMKIALQSRNEFSNLKFLDKCRKKVRSYTLDSLQKNYATAVAAIWSETREDKNILAVEFSSR